MNGVGGVKPVYNTISLVTLLTFSALPFCNFLTAIPHFFPLGHEHFKCFNSILWEKNLFNTLSLFFHFHHKLFSHFYSYYSFC